MFKVRILTIKIKKIKKVYLVNKNNNKFNKFNKYLHHRKIIHQYIVKSNINLNKISIILNNTIIKTTNFCKIIIEMKIYLKKRSTLLIYKLKKSINQLFQIKYSLILSYIDYSFKFIRIFVKKELKFIKQSYLYNF